MTIQQGWIGVDLDGTLAVYDGWKGIEHIGPPIARTVQYVRYLLYNGIEVRIFTARVQEGPRAVFHIKKWCREYLGQTLDVTDRKDMNMVCMIDDRALNPLTNLSWLPDWDLNNWDLIHAPLPPADFIVEAVKGHWSGPMAPPLELKR